MTKHLKHLPFVCLFALFSASASFAQDFSQEAPVRGAEAPLEMQQLRAQVDAMLDEMDELEGYRRCGEQGLIFKPHSNEADEDGCLNPTAELAPPPQVGKQLAAPAKRNDIAPTAKSFKLDDLPKGTDISLKSLGKPTPIQKLGVDMPAPVKPVATAPQPIDPLDRTIPPMEADYPSDRVKAVVEMAVAQALAGAQNVAEGGIIQPDDSVVNAPIANVTPQLSQAQSKPAPSTAAGLVPSCAEGEFLTVSGGEVVCRRAASAGKMACPPAVLRTYVDWHDQHIHFHIPYTPHGQTQSTEEGTDAIKVECNNGKYKMLEITRNECGGNACKPGRKPAYSMTYYCHQDKTDRCYAKQNGQLVSHTYSESYITKQY